MKRIVSVIFLLFVAAPAVSAGMLQEDGIETHLYTLKYPDGWRLESKALPVAVQGPDSEIMLITPALPAPDSEATDKMKDTDAMYEFWRERIRRVIEQSISEENMTIVEPYQESAIGSLPLLSGCSHTTSDKSFLCVYGLIGKGGAVFLITVEGLLKHEKNARDETVNMLKSIEWKI